MRWVENLPKTNKWGGPNKRGGWKMGFGIRKKLKFIVTNFIQICFMNLTDLT